MEEEKKIRKITWKAKGQEQLFYDCYVWVSDQEKLILKIDCGCWNFVNRRMKSFGLAAYKKHYAEPCKHLRVITAALEKINYKFKIPKMEGTERPTAELKRFLIERSNGICERKYCEEFAAEIHRIIPGVMGGKYSKENCVFICSDCHELIPK